MKVQAEISQSPKLEKYGHNSSLNQRMNQSKYKVEIGIGVNSGWALEGAFANEFKVEVSCVGPHVSLARRIQGFTKNYEAHILVSRSVFELSGNEGQQVMRYIDSVILEEQPESLEIYTIDIDTSGLALDYANKLEDLKLDGLQQHFKELEIKQKNLLEKFASQELTIRKAIASDHSLGQMREKYTDEFLQT